jgi:protoporphyrinogen oxidase
MRIGIIGGGLMGTALAYYLSETRHHVTLLEQGAQLGGLNGSITLEDGLTLSKFQHMLLPDDAAVLDLCRRLNLNHELIFTAARSGFMHNGSIYSLSSVWDFLGFGALGMRDRLRLANLIWQAHNMHNWHELDQIRVRDWLVQRGGARVFHRIWEPLLEAKFDYDYDDVPATYIWSWVRRMMTARRGPQLKSMVGYLRHGHMKLIEAMADVIVKRGGDIYTSTRVREIEVRNGQLGAVRTLTGVMDFDLLIAAVPTPTFARLIPGADEDYLAQLDQSHYLGLVCPALVLNRPLSGYWTLNITDPSSPFSSVIEMPHPIDARYHVVYLPKYTAPENDWMGVPDLDIRDAWLLRLRQFFPDLRPEHIQHFVVSRSRYADPVHGQDAAARLLPVQTPYDGLLLANTSQVYPALPTSEAAVLHAQRLAQMVASYQRRLVEAAA